MPVISQIIWGSLVFSNCIEASMTISRILHVIPTLEIGGAEMMLCKLLETWPEREKHHILPLLRPGALSNRANSTGAIIEPTANGGKFRMLRHLHKTVARIEPAVIVSWMYHANMLTGLLRGKNRRIPLIWNVRHALDAHSSEKRSTRLAIRANAILSRRADAILYNTNKAAEQHERVGFLPDRRYVIPNGFDCEIFRPDKKARERLLRVIGAQESGQTMVGLVARFNPIKNHTGFVRAIGHASQSNAKVVGIMVGRNVPNQRAELEQIAAESGAAGRIYCIDEQTDISRILPGFDIVALASHSEGFPNVIGEAMACGVPCVGTDVSDMRGIIGDTGLVVAPNDADALGKAIAELAKLETEERRNLGQRARDRIVNSFALQGVTDRYAEIVGSLPGCSSA